MSARAVASASEPSRTSIAYFSTLPDENASPLSIKAAGGVRNYEEAVEMIRLGVKRIGTSSAIAIANGEVSKSDY
jgi:deoxyribose-phosphate aldolase